MNTLKWTSEIYYMFLVVDASRNNTYKIISDIHFKVCIKVLIITDLGDKKLHKMLTIQQIFPKLYRCLPDVVFHNLESQKAGFVDVKKYLK